MYSYDEYTMLRLRLGRWADQEDRAFTHRDHGKRLMRLPDLIRFVKTTRERLIRRLSSAGL
jgi:hypothetical protein